MVSSAHLSLSHLAQGGSHRAASFPEIQLALSTPWLQGDSRRPGAASFPPRPSPSLFRGAALGQALPGFPNPWERVGLAGLAGSGCLGAGVSPQQRQVGPPDPESGEGRGGRVGLRDAPVVSFESPELCSFKARDIPALCRA